MRANRLLTTCFVSLFAAAGAAAAADEPASLPGTKPLTMDGDIASQLVDGVDKFLLRELDRSVVRRAKFWKYDASSTESYNKSIEPNRQRLAHILGVRDTRVLFDAPELIGTTNQPALVAKAETYDVFAVRWPAFGDVHGEGLLLVPTKSEKLADIVAIPDCEQTPEQICGLVEGVPAESQFARRLAEAGCRVIVPALISRQRAHRISPGRQGGPNLTHREYIYRSAFELGRHIIGYELQKVLACVDWFTKEAGAKDAKIGVIGYGEGGMLAQYAAALDTRIDATCTSGYFGPREGIWQQPLDRNVFGLLEQFGDAELAAMIASRSMLVELGPYPKLNLSGDGGGPAVLDQPAAGAAHREFDRFGGFLKSVRNTNIKQPPISPAIAIMDSSADKEAARLSTQALVVYCRMSGKPLDGDSVAERILASENSAPPKPIWLPDAAQRQERQVHELDRHNQWLLRESEYVRQDFMKKLDTSSMEKYKTSVEDYRKIFKDDVIGAFDYPLDAANPRTRKTYDNEKWTGYEVVLDVWPDVIAYGVLLLPKNMKPGEKRPVVVCQHGLEGRPSDVIAGDKAAYHDFAAKLCERGFITFAPQNLYIFQDRFRTLQRKANPLKKTLFSIIVPQHQQIVNWLKTQPNVDAERIAFYGLSYGGKSAMRIPPLVTDYCLSICSADFNEWVMKNASTRFPISYMWGGEYEIFEWDLGSTFNYAEMAALICPKPFMVERGHTDGVSTDEWVAYEFAKVNFLYDHKLKIGDRCELEVFDGPHTINGKGTFDFLHKHLNWPKPKP
jgi:dienelactone hydrolase